MRVAEDKENFAYKKLVAAHFDYLEAMGINPEEDSKHWNQDETYMDAHIATKLEALNFWKKYKIFMKN